MQSQLTQPIGDLLREWRRRRKLSQLELAVHAEVSARHLSFVETGRSAPSRDLALRQRTQLRRAAGYPPAYREGNREEPRLAAVREMARRGLAAHEPFPALVMDRYGNRVEANDPAWLFRVGVSPELLEEPVNVL